MADNRAYYMSRMLDTIRERKKALAEAAKVDPSAAALDSVATSKERVVAGTATAADSTRLRMANVPGFEEQKPEKLTDYAAALGRIREGKGDRADSVHVGLAPRATNPPAERKPTYGFREVIDPKTGKKIIARTNNLTGAIEPARTDLVPAGGNDTAEGDYERAMGRANQIGHEIVSIDNILNDPKLKDGATFTDEFGVAKYYDRAALTKQREALVKEQKHYQRKTEDAEISRIKPGPKGHKILSPSGRTYVSDGTRYIAQQ